LAASSYWATIGRLAGFCATHFYVIYRLQRILFLTKVVRANPLDARTAKSAAAPESDGLYGFTCASGSVQCDTKVAGIQYLCDPSNDINQLRFYPAVFKVFLKLKYNTTIPLSAPVERLFSAAGQILVPIKPRRNRLSDDTFEKLLFLKKNNTS